MGYNGARNTGSDVRVAAIARQVKALFGADKVQLTVMTLNSKSMAGYFDEDVELLEFEALFPCHVKCPERSEPLGFGHLRVFFICLSKQCKSLNYEESFLFLNPN